MRVPAGERPGKLQEGLWLVWNYQGSRTLEALIQSKNYPGNMAKVLLGVELVVEKKNRGSAKEVAEWVEWEVAQVAMKQLLESIRCPTWHWDCAQGPQALERGPEMRCRGSSG